MLPPAGGAPADPATAAPAASTAAAAADDDDAAPAEADPADPFAPLTRTGIAATTIVWVPNGLRRGRPVSDLDGAIDLQDAVNAKQTQIARVLAKHADPKLYVPDQGAEMFGSAYASDNLLFGDGPDGKPSHVTWTAELTAAMEDREFAVANLLVAMEMSPSLLGLKDSNAKATAYKAMKIYAMPAIKKAARKAVYWTAGLRRLLSVAQDLEQTLPGARFDRLPVGVTLRDGIPLDEIDQANAVSTYRAAGVMSVERAVTVQLDDPTAVQAELAKLEDEARKAAAANPFAFGPGTAAPTPSGGGEPVDPPLSATADADEAADASEEVAA